MGCLESACDCILIDSLIITTSQVLYYYKSEYYDKARSDLTQVAKIYYNSGVRAGRAMNDVCYLGQVGGSLSLADTDAKRTSTPTTP